MTKILVTCLRGTGQYLKKELRRLGYSSLRTTSGSVMIEGELEDVARLCLYSRIAHRVGWTLVEGRARDFDKLYDLVASINRSQWIVSGRPVHVQVYIYESALYAERSVQSIAHKAIIDSLIDDEDHQRDEDPAYEPQIVRVSLVANELSVQLDASGQALGQRGYRLETGVAPLKENLACALLYGMGRSWRQALLDPCVGSGTIAIEAAMIASNRAPGLERSWLCESWPCRSIDSVGMRDAARGEIYTDGNYQITGRDIDPLMIDIASSNADRAGVAQLISREVGDVADVKMDTGMVITNPPYGQRLDSPDVGEVHDALLALYSDDVGGGMITAYDIGYMDLEQRKHETRYNGGEQVTVWKRK